MGALELDYAQCLRKWGFNRDPFQERYPIIDDFWAGPSDKREHLQFLLRSAMSDEAIVNILITGEYGSGKTYVLRTLQTYAHKNLQGLGIYLEIPWRAGLKGFRDFFVDILREIGADTLSSIGNKIKEQEKLDNRDSFKEHLLKLDIGINNDLARALANLVYDFEVGLTWTWLSTNATIYHQRTLGFESNPRDDGVAVDLLLGIFNYLSLGYNIVVLLIDELENLVGESAAMRSIRTGFRNLYDSIIYGKRAGKFAIFAAATATALYQLEMTLGVAILDRFDERVDLGKFTEEQARLFVLGLLNHARVGEQSLCPPFKDDDAFKEYLVRARTAAVLAGAWKSGAPDTPRRLIKAGKFLLRYACEKEVFPLNTDFISSYLV